MVVYEAFLSADLQGMVVYEAFLSADLQGVSTSYQLVNFPHPYSAIRIVTLGVLEQLGSEALASPDSMQD
jgi:predicted transposase YdaD